MSKERKYRKKKKLGSYPSISVIFSMTLALFVLGLFALLLSTTNSLTRIIQNNVEIQAYLDSDLSDTEISRLNKFISSKPFTLNNENVSGVAFISKEAAAKNFIDETGEDFMKFLGKNPLRDAFTIKIAPDFHSNEQMQIIQQELESTKGIFEVIYVENMIQSINENVTKISLVLLAIAAILILVIIILINNTIKLALFSQRFLIRSMQLVGAKKSFIRAPFVYRAILHGITAGLLAAAMLYALITLASERITGLDQLQNTEYTYIIFGALVALGALIAIFGTYKAIQKYLAMSLEELY
jgi:cell division transport system permease protein